MSITASVYIAASLDGFIARTDGSLDWLTGGSNDSSEDYGYARFMDSIDVLILGKSTFQTVSGFTPWPYEKRTVMVLSTTLSSSDVPATLRDSVSVTSEPPAKLLARLEREGFRHAYVDGGATIQSFLREDRIDEITITRIPVLLGSGIPLFGSLSADIPLSHLETASFPSGFVQSKYRVNRQVIQ